MLLNDASIRARMAGHMIDPVTKEDTFRETTSGKGVFSYGLSSAGYDFRLGENIKAFSSTHSVMMDPLEIKPDSLAFVDLKPFSKFKTIHDESGTPVSREYRYVVIPPHGYILGETVEYLDIPEDILIVVLGKSTYARAGIIVNCTPLEPGWRGRVTLEIGNLSDVPAVIYTGMGICQGLFFQLSGTPERSYRNKAGKYQDQTGLTLPRVL